MQVSLDFFLFLFFVKHSFCHFSDAAIAWLFELAIINLSAWTFRALENIDSWICKSYYLFTLNSFWTNAVLFAPENDELRLILCIVQVFKRRLKCFYGNTNIDQNIDSVIVQ